MKDLNKTTFFKFINLLIFIFLFQISNAQYNFSKIDSWLKDNLSAIGGRAVLVIYKDGKMIYSQAENGLNGRQKMVAAYLAKKGGKDRTEAVADFNMQSKERIASSSKWLSAALVMSFVDEGKLSLEDTIGKFLPVMTANGKGGIKIWQCLCHETGIESGNLKESLSEFKSSNSMDEVIAIIAQKPMEGIPGKTFHYSNYGLQIAVAVIEKIAGKSFETLFNERIAGPCDMQRSDFGFTKVPLPAGGGWSTAEDYLHFLTMILNGGKYNGKQVLSQNAITEMQKNRVNKEVKIIYSPAEAGHWGYGFGEWTMQDLNIQNNATAISSPGLFGAFPWIDKKYNYAAFLMAFNLNTSGRHELYSGLKQLVEETMSK